MTPEAKKTLNSLFDIHSEYCQRQFESETEQDRQEAFVSARTIRACIPRILGELVDDESERKRFLEKLNTRVITIYESIGLTEMEAS